MLRPQLSGGYLSFGGLRNRCTGSESPAIGQFFVLQLDTQIIGRGRIAIVEQLPASAEDHANWIKAGVIVDLFARFEPRRNVLRLPLNGRIVTRDAETLRQKNETDIQGHLLLDQKTIRLSLGEDADFGELQLFHAFELGDLSETELWAEHFLNEFHHAKTWSLFLAHEHLRTPLEKYLRQSPFSSNVFVMMRFQDTKHNAEIRRAIESALKPHGLTAQFADNLTVADTLWDNVCAYMLGSQFGIAVIEEIEERSFNPNVALEIGFMLALQRQVLVLKDKRVPSMPADLMGHVYSQFDSYDIETTVVARIDAWIEELIVLGVIPKGGRRIQVARGDTILDDDMHYL
jgi:CAP12/Pycsar effector protein, TIR domain